MSTTAIITPIYATPENGRLNLFGQTVKSVLREGYPYFVYLVIGDGSKVDVERFLREYHDPRVRYVRRDRLSTDLKTASNALNLGIDLCLEKSGDVFTRSEANDLCAVAFLHLDDLLTEKSVEVRVRYLGKGYVHTNMAFFNERGKIIEIRSWRGESDRDYILAVGNHFLFNHHTIMWQLEFLQYLKDFVARKYQQSGVFDPLLSHGEDRDVSLSSAEAAIRGGYEIRHIPSVSVFYRYHHQSITGEPVDSNYRKAQENRIFQKHFGQPESREKMLELLARLKSDLPWSLGTVLPIGIRRRLKPIRDYTKSLTFELLHPEMAKNLESLNQL